MLASRESGGQPRVGARANKPCGMRGEVRPHGTVATGGHQSVGKGGWLDFPRAPRVPATGRDLIACCIGKYCEYAEYAHVSACAGVRRTPLALATHLYTP